MTKTSDGAGVAEGGDLVPGEAGLEEDLLGVLAELGGRAADARRGVAEADRRADDVALAVGLVAR